MAHTDSDSMQKLEKAMQRMCLGGISTEQSITDMANAASDSMRMLEKAMQHLTIGDTATEQNLSTAITTTSSSQTRPSLLTIPQKLRNQIFSYVYEVEPGRIDSGDSHPSIDSIIACRQLYNEFKEMYLHAFHSYWPESRLYMKIFSANEITTAINGLRHAPGAGLRHLRQVGIFCMPLSIAFEYREGVWVGTRHWVYNQTFVRTLVAGPTSPHLHTGPPFAQYASSKLFDILSRYQHANKIGDPSQGRGLSFDCIATMLTVLEVEIDNPLWENESFNWRLSRRY